MKRLPQHLNIIFLFLKKQQVIFLKILLFILVKINFDVDYSNHKGITIKAVRNFLISVFYSRACIV